MTNDLKHFRKSVLRQYTLRQFVEYLPTTRLQNQFRASMGVASNGNLYWYNKLQGYRGPDGSGGDSWAEYLGPRDGLQEVNYWWGTSKHWHWVPIVGQITWSIRRVAENTDWNRLYFDCETGECLGHRIEKAASKLNKKGETLLQSGKFNEAKTYFSNAYKHEKMEIFKANEVKAQVEIDALNLNSEGDTLFNQGKYAEARAKYQAAYDKSCVSEQRKIYESNRDNKIDALKLEMERIELEKIKMEEMRRNAERNCGEARAKPIAAEINTNIYAEARKN